MPTRSSSPARQVGTLSQTRTSLPVVRVPGILDGLADLVSVVRAEADALEDRIAIALEDTPELPLGRIRVSMSIEWDPWQGEDNPSVVPAGTCESTREYLVMGHREG